jgi:choline dehydrogenase-like flavoprotein
MRDVIVVGAGGGGPVVAKELAARGLDVLLLEAGARFADPEREWTHFEDDAANPAGGFLRFGPADRSAPPWRRELPQNSALLQVAGVGGTTLHYVGNSPRAMPGAFRDYAGSDRDAYDTAHRFPFGYRELVPYYEWVEATLPVQTAAMGTKEEIFLAAAARLGLPAQSTKDIVGAAYRPQENAILQPTGNAGTTDDPTLLRYPLAGGCTFCGHCTQGCVLPRSAPRNLKAKRSTDNSYVPMALTADRWAGGKAVTLLTDAFAVRVDTDERGTARRVTWRVGATGELFTEETRVVVLAAGAVETPRLWLNSGLPNPNDWVGRGLTDHATDAVLGVLPADAGASRGPSSAARVDYPGRGGFEQVGTTPALAARGLALSDAGIAGAYANGRQDGTQGADAVGRLVGPELKAALADLDRLLVVIVLTDDDVEARNRVTLATAAPPDEHGPIARVEINGRTRSPRTRENREFLVGRAVALMRAAGATRVYRPNWPPVLMHVHSTMRMGTAEADSVLDADGEARGVPRLFVADNSALANALGGPNPTLTTQALATRTAETIFRRYFGGDPWIEAEAPVASTDPRVTQAVAEHGLA